MSDLTQQREDFEAAYKKQYPDASPWVWRHFVHSERGYTHDVTDGMFKMYLKGCEHKINSLKPIDMILHCPLCGLQHVDEPECSLGPGNSERIDWTNPPHRSHLCHGCGFVWRPADVPTNGVKTITTRGKSDTVIPTGEIIPTHLGMVIEHLGWAADEIATGNRHPVSGTLIRDAQRLLRVLQQHGESNG